MFDSVFTVEAGKLPGTWCVMLRGKYTGVCRTTKALAERDAKKMREYARSRNAAESLPPINLSYSRR